MNAPDKKVVCLAKFEGRCAHCDGLIRLGDKIELKHGSWEHEDCPVDPPDDETFVDLDVGDRL